MAFLDYLIDLLPPEGLDEYSKTFLYASAFILVISSMLARFSSAAGSSSRNLREARSAGDPSRAAPPSSEDPLDIIGALKIEKTANEAALSSLRSTYDRGELSESVHDRLFDFYSTRVQRLEDELARYESELNLIDIEQRLRDLNDTEPEAAPTPEVPLTTPVEAVEPAAPAPEAPAATPSPPAPVATPPAPTPAAPTPAATPPAPTPAAAPPSPAIPSPPTPSSIPAPVSTSEATPAPPAPPSPSAPPQPPTSIPSAPSSPSMPQTPEAAMDDDSEGVFAKSTSIAALRMEMLRELARLKKFMSDQEKK